MEKTTRVMESAPPQKNELNVREFQRVLRGIDASFPLYSSEELAALIMKYDSNPQSMVLFWLNTGEGEYNLAVDRGISYADLLEDISYVALCIVLGESRAFQG